MSYELLVERNSKAFFSCKDNAPSEASIDSFMASSIKFLFSVCWLLGLFFDSEILLMYNSSKVFAIDFELLIWLCIKIDN